MGRKLTKGEFIAKYSNVENSKFVDVIGEYNGCNQKIECICKICGKHFSTTPDHLMQNHIHKGCAISIGRTSNTNEFKEKLKNINDDVEILGEYINAKTKIKCKCKLVNKFEKILTLIFAITLIF